jgi:hypothetical protein
VKSVQRNTIVGLLPTRTTKDNEVCKITENTSEIHVHTDGVYLTELVFVKE